MYTFVAGVSNPCVDGYYCPAATGVCTAQLADGKSCVRTGKTVQSLFLLRAYVQGCPVELCSHVQMTAPAVTSVVVTQLIRQALQQMGRVCSVSQTVSQPRKSRPFYLR